MRRSTLITALAAAALGAAPAASAEPAQGPWSSPQVAIVTVSCEGEDTTVAVMVPQAAFGSAAAGRPGGVAHILGTTAKHVSLSITAELDGVPLPPPPFVRPVGLGEGQWGRGVERSFSCSWLEETEFGTILITVSGFVTPRR